MGYFFNFSQTFLGTLAYLGDILLYCPFSDVDMKYNPSEVATVPDWVMDVLYEVLPSLTIGEMVFGSFLLFILVWKLICFFTDIIA